MSIHVALTHRTTYRYDRPITMGPQVIRLRPAPHARGVLSYALTVAPKPHFLNWQQDPQGNFLARVVFPEKVTHFDVTVDLLADMATVNPFDFFLEPQAESFPFSYDPALEQELRPYRKIAKGSRALQAFIDTLPRAAASTNDFLVAINQAVQQRVAYVVRMEPGVWTPTKTLTEGRGSCRDSAWLLVQVLRNLGLAARFVSGYLIQLVADVKPLEGPDGPTADFTDLHAWAEVYLPGAGWVGLDATSGLLTGEGHIPLAATPAPQSAAPISGATDKAEVEFGFEMSVRRVVETPRVTKPYAEDDWAAILAAGARVDRALAAGDVRLTMGGEPTFVALTDVEAEEWNTAALGPTKRGYGSRLIRKLIPDWAPGAALHHGVGKQYPGEPLPRWAITALWRKDGEPAWQRPALLANPDQDTGTADHETAAAFASGLAEALEVDPRHVQPALEDIHYYLWKEKRLPANVAVEDSKLADPLERARLARLFATGLAKPAGSVLPLARKPEGGWRSAKWFFRDELIFLLPGDGSIGVRLPLDSLPWQDPDEVEHLAEIDPFADQPKLPAQLALQTGHAAPTDQRAVPQPAPDTDKSQDVVRTALTVEARGGILHVFFPPLTDAADWLALVGAVEATAAAQGQKIVLEGYLPPHSDTRLQRFSVTPDPGVIEVNVHPAPDFQTMVERTEHLYATARAVGLGSEKFLADGRHVGTGGGNHVVLGAATPADSPFLRRPDLLKSMVGFWNNHPSLSYLFSGLFIGPTSQHPRLDEARGDALNELEIAFSQVDRDTPAPPWVVDRLFRNILTDMTGNTHRTEFCIDKLYDPGSSTGRLGLLELRGFEMPPSPRMAVAQTLLVRAAVAAFWQRPYERQLVRWGTRLHDDFLLPYYCQDDFGDALDELAAFGVRLDPAWFAPHQEFRFPALGEIDVRNMNIELRHALEPWHVLGEEQAAGGTARYVDSSAERVQVRTQGWVEERYVLACNGVAVPMSRTARAGEFVAGVRFKAWQPPSALHPTIPAQVPLIFDVYDRWTGRSLGGMAHHVSHPGGRAHEDFPVNANAAEARRRARFLPFGHTPGAMPEPKSVRGWEHPRTLDLRRYG